jgi:N-glycosylase/DNA lyase
MNKRNYAGVEALLAEFHLQKDAIKTRLEEFARVPREAYFYELAYCLLTPQSSAVNAERAIETLREADCFDQPEVSARILQTKAHYVRFHNTKARRLAEANAQSATLHSMLHKGLRAEDLRRWLVKHVHGLGWKEASHFLRNIGYRDLAILDRHILKNLRVHNVIRKIPKTLTPKRYHAIEQQFRLFAREVGISMDELDLLFWSRETGEILK